MAHLRRDHNRAHKEREQKRDELNRAHKERDREFNMQIDKLEEEIDQLARMICARESQRDGLDKAIREKPFEDDSKAFSSRMASGDGMESTKKRKNPPEVEGVRQPIPSTPNSQGSKKGAVTSTMAFVEALGQATQRARLPVEESQLEESQLRDLDCRMGS